MKRLLSLALFSIGAAQALGGMRFVVTDPVTGRAVPALIEVQVAGEPPCELCSLGTAVPFDVDAPYRTGRSYKSYPDQLVTLHPGQTLTLTQQQPGPPVKEITIIVRASRLIPNKPPAGASGTTRDRNELQKFTNTTGGDQKSLVKGQSGVAEDSAGQAHVRGEHADISYVVDGVPLPDTLSGREGSVVVPSTIQSLDILTGGFAPEFGGQTAAVLNITTVPGARTFRGDGSLQAGSYKTVQGDTTLEGPIGKRASFVLNLGGTSTDLNTEPHQPDHQDAHNHGTSRSGFTALRFRPTGKDTLTLTLSQNPDAEGIPNRTGLPDSFAQAGEGFGFLGLRNADGSRPDAGVGGLGSENILLPSQQKAGMDIDQDEVSEFGTLNFQHRFSKESAGQLAFTVLHSGSDLTNHNPAVDPLNLPVDNSIEYNPLAIRNVHHVQFTGSANKDTVHHKLKVGFLYDIQSGHETYQLQPASQLALDELAAIAPNLAPPGSTNGQTDVDGNPVYIASGAAPVVHVSRSGSYGAAYAQDTFLSGRFTANYGFRFDYYEQKQNLGQAPVKENLISPRINLAYRMNRRTEFRASYDRIFNTPPLAQGAVVGQPIHPEKINQYDLGIAYDLGRGQSLGLAYYYKDIRDQVDTGLLIPGSDIGLYSAVNLEKGGVHGVEFSYNIAAPKGVGWDGYFNYSFSAAKPNGVDNTGAPVGDFNDHDQRHSIGAGLAYTWKDGMTASMTYEFGSGLASSPVPPSENRVSRYEVDFKLSTPQILFGRRAALTLDIENLTDQRSVINFESAFSGTRFMMGRRIYLGIAGKF